MKYVDFKLDLPYRVVAGDNGSLAAGDIIWVDSIAKCLNNATQKGWLDPDECTDDVFEGVSIEPARDYAVLTQAGDGTRCYPISLAHTWPENEK